MAVKVIEQYKLEVNQLSLESREFIRLIKSNSGREKLQGQFRKCREAYKKVEWLAEYYYPYSAKRINGPALPEVEPDEKKIVVSPEGFQVIEELLFTDDHNIDASILHEANLLFSNIGRLSYLVSIQETTDAHIFDALRLEIFRIIALGISGFDSPVANNSLPEAATALKSVRDNFLFYQQNGDNGNTQMDDSTINLLNLAIRSLDSATQFNTFNRLHLITKYLNPLSENLLLAQQHLGIPLFSEPRALRADATTLFATNIFNVDFYAPGTQAYGNLDKVILGQKLFFDNFLSGNGKRSCATCHQPGKAFTDGLPTSFTLDGKSNIRRNAPTLLNAALQPALFYDMRVNYLEDQAKDVISNKDEMHGSMEKALKNISLNTEYRRLFEKVYPNEKISETQVKNSLAAYIRSLVKMNSRFDQYMRGDPAAMNQTEMDGFNLFTGKAKCGTCHFVPLFNGSNPPGFDKIDAEVIGVPATADSMHAVLDTDPGKYNLFKIDLHRNAFKTPTLRNVEVTSPFMHNGVFKTLEDVVEFYNRGGGVGLGLKVANQTLPPDPLNLSPYEKASLVAFMKTLTDTSGTSRSENYTAIDQALTRKSH